MARYSFEEIEDRTTPSGVHWRIRDERDNRVATCYDHQNAVLVVMALNFAAGEPVDWVCGHNAQAHCAQCWQELAAKSHTMAVALLESDTIEEARKHVGARNAA
jgi:hypothetical protein